MLCQYMFNILRIILGSIGCTVLRKTPCPVLVVFLCHGWFALAVVEEMSNI